MLFIWGIAIFSLTVVFLTYTLANDIYTFSTSNYSKFSTTTIDEIKSNEWKIRTEFALRSLWGKHRGNRTCHSTEIRICNLADEMYSNIPAELWEPNTGDLVAIVSIGTGIFAMLFSNIIVFIGGGIK
jgi:hypothetical protein